MAPNESFPSANVSRFRIVAWAAVTFAVVAALLRVALFVRWRAEGDLSALRLPVELAVGALYDLAAFAWLAAPAAIVVAFAPERLWTSRVIRVASFVAWCVFAYALVLEATAEWFFWDEFGARFNFVAVDYLVYTGEVAGNIRESYPVEWILPLLLVPAGLIVALTWPRARKAFTPSPERGGRLLPALACIALPFAAWFALDDRLAHLGENRYESELSLNGVWSFGNAFWKNSLSYEDFYATRDRAESYARLHGLLGRETGASAFDLTRRVENPGPEKRHNVVLITVESLAARYMAFSGGKRSELGLTPRLDALAAEGILFTRLYSTGTRTVRGLEALTLSIPPTPGQSVVKRPANEDLFSTGFLFGERGYDTKFVYGGYGLFDNMNFFFAHNGFTAVDRTDFAEDERTFGNVWGVCDEDLFRRVGREADASNAAGRPFYLHVMTTSNHQPYTYPSGRIDIPSGTGREGAVKYTDWAIGRFIDEARTRPWFDDTIFVIVGDHTDNGRGFTELPVDRFHVAALVYAPKIVKPRRFDGVCSQIDLPPTLLGILGWTYESKFFGEDVFARPPARALVGNYLHVGLYDGSRLVTLGPHHDVAIDRIGGSWKPHRIDDGGDALVGDAVAYYQVASDALKRGLFGRIAAGSPSPAAQSPGRIPDDPIRNFGLVAPGIYRGGQPEAKDWAHLRALGVKTVLDLRLGHSERAEVEEAGMRALVLPMPSGKDARTPGGAEIRRFFDIVLDPANQPVFVHCAHGVDRTGALFAAYRMEIDGWTPGAALSEMREFGFADDHPRISEFVQSYRLLGVKPSGSGH